MGMFDFLATGGQSGPATYEEVMRKRALAEALGVRADASPQTFGAGLSALGAGIGSMLAGRRASKADAERAAMGDAAFNEALGGMPDNRAALVGALTNNGVDTAPGDGTSNAANLIAEFEGFRETPYWDVNALRTGYGSDTVTLPDGTVQRVGKGTRVDREGAARDLNRRVGSEFMPAAARAVGEDLFGALAPNQQAALTSIAYNYGNIPRAVAQAVRTPGIDDDVAAIRGLSVHNDGVNAKRRNREADIYAGGGGQSFAPTAMAAPQAPGVNVSLIRAMNSPYMTPEQKQILSGVYQQQQAQQSAVYEQQMRQQAAQQGALFDQQLRQSDPMYQAQLQAAQLQNEAAMNPAPPKPQSLVNAGDGRLYDPNSGQWITAPQMEGGGFRAATPEEAGQYGAAAGQFGPDGRFHAINPPSGFSVETGPDGTTRIVQGPGVSGGGGKPLTEGQSKDAVYATRAEGALTALEPVAGALVDRASILADKTPLGIGRGVQSDAYQVARNAGDEFLQAILRKDTGAAITNQEQDMYGVTYLPQPGDGPALLEQKAVARRRALEALKAGMPAEAILQQEKALSASGGNKARKRYNPQTGAFE